MDEKFFKKVVNICELEQDLEMLPGGDLTEIGEKGWREKNKNFFFNVLFFFLF